MGQGKEPKIFQLLVQQRAKKEHSEPRVFFQCLGCSGERRGRDPSWQPRGSSALGLGTSQSSECGVWPSLRRSPGTHTCFLQAACGCSPCQKKQGHSRGGWAKGHCRVRSGHWQAGWGRGDARVVAEGTFRGKRSCQQPHTSW